MPKSKNSFNLLFVFIFFPGLFLTRPLSAQSDLPSEGLRGLQKQIEELRETQKVMQRDLQEIKVLLQGRAGAPNTPPPNLTVGMADSPFKGNKTAKLTLIEFSDYQCPFCARHFRETLPQILKDYINTGKLKYVLRDFPLESIHKDAFKAAEAANCAGEQGKYWGMHDRLFQNQNQLGTADLPKHAQAIGLKTAEFEECLRNGKRAEKIRKDLEDGRRAGVQGTPTFFLGTQDTGGRDIKVLRVIPGALPYAQFKEAIDEALNQTRK